MNWKLLIIATIVVLSMQETPPTWGGSPRYTVKVKMVNNDPKFNWTFTYYYDWNLKAERYEHQTGEYDEMCFLATTPFKKDGQACTIVFSSDGWSYISFPQHNFCCKCTNGFGAINYNWLKDNSTFVGTETLQGYSVTHWTKQGLYLNHYWSTVDKQLPVRFFEIKKGNPKYWLFDTKSYNTAPIDPSKFGPQCTNRCFGQCLLFDKPETSLNQEQ